MDVEIGDCRECGSRALFVDNGRGDVVCGDCGAVDPDERVVFQCAGYRETFDRCGSVRASAPRSEAYESGQRNLVAPRQERRSPPYDRRTYFNERIAQWRCREPAIPEDDYDIILRTHNSPPFNGAPLGKEDVRRLLRTIDARLSTKRFGDKYLVSSFLTSSCSSSATMIHGGSCVHGWSYL